MPVKHDAGNLLCVANFATNTGYAWDFIEGLYAAVADDVAQFGIRTWVAYPTIGEPPASLSGSAAIPLALCFDLDSPGGLRRVLRTVREHHIRVIYLSDRPAWHPAYALLRWAGVRTIIVHDHTSGERTAPRGFKRALKALSRRFRPALADTVLTVSRYVRDRKETVDLIPPERLHIMFNSVTIPDQIERDALREMFAVQGRPIIACACRAAEYKGVQYLLQAFDLVAPRMPVPPVLIYFGDGPYRHVLTEMVATMAYGNDVTLAGYVPEAATLLAGADVCVVPSIWGEAFGLAALEPGARGVPVIASNVGGIPEIIIDGVNGLLVPPGDPAALADAIERLMVDADLRRRLGTNARRRAAESFSRAEQIAQLRSLFRREFHIAAA